MTCVPIHSSLVKKFPTEINLDIRHNHPTMCSEALKYRRVNPDVKDKFLELFQRGHSVAESVLTQAFAAYRSLLPPSPFNGKDEPTVIITDYCTAQRKVLSTVFPSAILLLCIFHVLQTVWRWLWDFKKHGIPQDCRRDLYLSFKELVYEEDEDKVNMETLISFCDEVTKYPKYQKFVENLLERKTEWAVCHREALPTRGKNTNNYAEAAMKTFKEKVIILIL